MHRIKLKRLRTLGDEKLIKYYPGKFADMIKDISYFQQVLSVVECGLF